MLADTNRFTGDLESVDCENCLASDEMKAAKMESLLVDLIDPRPPADRSVLNE